MDLSNANIEQTLIAVERKACTDSFYEFLVSFWDTIVAEPMKDNWHIKYLCDELQYLSTFVRDRKKKPYDLAVNVPPGSTKTTIVLQAFPAWLWIDAPFARIISSSHGHDLSEASANKSKDIIQSKKYQLFFPHVRLRRDSTAKSRYANTKGGNRHTTSTNGNATGDHAHIKLMDDLQDISKSASVANREAAINHMKMLFTREVEKGNSINVLIMQRLNELDCTSYLLSLSAKRKVKHICLPAIANDSIKPPELRKYYINGLLDPVRMSNEILEEKKIELGSYGFDSQFQQDPTPPEGNLIKRSWFKILPKANYLKEHHTHNFFLDTAYRERSKKIVKGEAVNDPTGLLSCCMVAGIVYLYNYIEVYEKLPGLVKFIPKWVYANNYSNNSRIMIEPKASGISTVDTVREYTKLNVMEIEGAKDDKLTELTNASASIESGRFILVEGTWNKLFLDRVCGFPHAAHDEAVDLLCYAKKYYLGVDFTEGIDEALEKALRLLG